MTDRQQRSGERGGTWRKARIQEGMMMNQAPAQLSGLVLCSIGNSPFDFRTTDSLVKEFNVPRCEMVTALETLWRAGRIRHPVGWEKNIYRPGRDESEWWRYADRGTTRREKWREVWALIGMCPMSNGRAPSAT